MAEPLFSDKQKNKLAQHKVLYKHNLSQASQYAQCSLQAASALFELCVIFAEVVERIRSQKEMVEFLRRLQDNVKIEIQFKSDDLETRKIELKDSLTELIRKNRAKITRLRKSANK